MDNNFKRFIPIAKVDDEKRMVYGFASTPDLDSDGEVVEVAALAKALPEYMKFPTIREMHQAKAAGTTKETKIDDTGLYIGAKVVADDAWKLVKEGVYKGFSIGGRVISKVANKIKDLSLIEISLVDVPANKAAVIEVWKSKKTEKAASGVSMFTGLMNHLRDIIAMQQAMKKKTKPLERMLEEIKGFIANEASEKEPEKDKDGMMPMIMMLDQRINTIKNLQLGENNQFAEIIRKGVLQTLMDKKDQLKKEEKKDEKPVTTEAPADKPADANQPAAPAAPVTPAEDKDKKEVKPETTTPETTSTDAPAANDDKSENADTLKKLADIDKKLEKMTPVKITDVKSLDLAKTVSAIAGTIAKMASYLEKVEARIVKLENTPAATKSKSAVVLKQLADKSDEQPVNKTMTDAHKKELETKKARLTELNKIFDSVGKNEFAKQGFSTEAMKLEKEIAQLQA